jgi:hypothetical protein
MSKKVEVIGRKIGNFSAEPETTEDQIAFSMTIPGGTLGEKNKLRLAMFWKGSRATPDDDTPEAELNEAECQAFTGNEEFFRIENHCGFFIDACVPDEVTEGLASLSVKYRNKAVGHAQSGPAFFVASGSTRASFKGYAVIYDAQVKRLTLGKWVDQPLTTIPTTLDQVSLTLVAGDVVKLEKDQSTNEITVSVNDVETLTATDSAISFFNPGIGIVGIGSTPAPVAAVEPSEGVACLGPAAAAADLTPAQDWSELAGSCSEYVGDYVGGSGCCPVGEGEDLTIECCSPPPCELLCRSDGAYESGDVTVIFLKACGGYPPYTWSSSDNGYVFVPGGPAGSDPNVRAVYYRDPSATTPIGEDDCQVQYGIFLAGTNGGRYPGADTAVCEGSSNGSGFSGGSEVDFAANNHYVFTPYCTDPCDAPVGAHVEYEGGEYCLYCGSSLLGCTNDPGTQFGPDQYGNYYWWLPLGGVYSCGPCESFGCVHPPCGEAPDIIIVTVQDSDANQVSVSITVNAG